MQRNFLASLLVLSFMVVGGCNGNAGNDAKKIAESQEKAGTRANAAGSVSAILKEKELAGYRNATIGKAFESYRFFKKKEWRETAANGKFYVDFTGWFGSSIFDLAGLSDRPRDAGVEIKFVIDQEGAFYVAMISRIESKDGKMSRYPLQGGKRILDAIYENRELDRQ